MENYIGLDTKNRIITLAVNDFEIQQMILNGNPFTQRIDGVRVRCVEITEPVDMKDVEQKVRNFGKKHDLEVIIVEGK